MATIAEVQHRYYAGVDTDELIRMLDDAKERAELTPDAVEKERWRMRLESIKEELLLRQQLHEELEL